MNHFKLECPKCSEIRFWETGDNRLKCRNCRHVFTLKPNPLNIPNKILNEVVSEFILEHSTNIILERVNISKYKLLKVLTFLRKLMARDIPEPCREIIKVSEEYPANQIKRPIIGILFREGTVYAKVLPNLTPEDLKFFIKNKNKLMNLSEAWQKYFGLAFKGSLYRLAPKEKHQINTLEAFWGYLKRKLSAKGGIRKEKMPLYLGEYTWRYNNRKLTLRDQEEKLLKSLRANCLPRS